MIHQAKCVNCGRRIVYVYHALGARWVHHAGTIENPPYEYCRTTTALPPKVVAEDD